MPLLVLYAAIPIVHRSIRSLLPALLTLACCARALAAPAIDYAREERWAQEVVPTLVVGEAVYLRTPTRTTVLALLTEPSGSSKGGVVMVHGLGVHPDFGLIGGLRSRLADAGYTTLSVQMPVLPADASRDDYGVALPEARERLHAAIAYLRAKGIDRIALVSHSMGATMADAYLKRPDAARIDAWIPVGMLIPFGAAPREAVLDVAAEHELPQVIEAAPARRKRLPADGCSRQVIIPATDHYFERAQPELSAVVAAFLDRALAGRCQSSRK
ncbi:MAG: alpha/beta fold hydrolase [Betaproteobacteria bacterium]